MTGAAARVDVHQHIVRPGAQCVPVHTVATSPSAVWQPRSGRDPWDRSENCEIFSARRGLQVHHLRKLADLNRPGRPDRPPWMTQMASRRRKTLVVCSACHHNIHAGPGSALPQR
ncbi:HNH endonuclease [Streptomyces sp. NPDC001617]